MMRLIYKPELLDRVGLSYCTIWTMMRDGRFPRSRVVGGKIAWYESDIDRWLEQLPVRRLKGDPPEQEQTKGQ